MLPCAPFPNHAAKAENTWSLKTPKISPAANPAIASKNTSVSTITPLVQHRGKQHGHTRSAASAGPGELGFFFCCASFFRLPLPVGLP
jgi:hypothetical protein